MNIIIVLQWLETEFIPYLEQWEKSVMEREGFSAKDKELMLLAREIRIGITITGICIIVLFERQLHFYL